MLETFDIKKQPIKDLVEWIGNQWNNTYGIWKVYKYGNHIKLEIHTGGWSQNEELISEFERVKFIGMFWQKSEKGGHYYYSFPLLTYFKNLEFLK